MSRWTDHPSSKEVASREHPGSRMRRSDFFSRRRKETALTTPPALRFYSILPRSRGPLIRCGAAVKTTSASADVNRCSTNVEIACVDFSVSEREGVEADFAPEHCFFFSPPLPATGGTPVRGHFFMAEWPLRRNRTLLFTLRRG